MAKWKPHGNVGPNEQIGRRMFDEPMLNGTAGQPSYSGIALTHFVENRGDEISLDRLGASGIDRHVQKYLIPRATADGQKFRKPKQFDGWAVVSAKELIQARKEPKLQVHPSPIDEPEPNDNLYHAHVMRPEGWNPYQTALHLRHIFTSYGRVEQNKVIEETWRDWLLVKPVVKWILGIIGLLRKGG